MRIEMLASFMNPVDGTEKNLMYYMNIFPV